jgi:hypothetical protein
VTHQSTKRKTRTKPVNRPTKANQQNKFRVDRWRPPHSRRRSSSSLVGRGDRRSISSDQELAAQQRFNQIVRFQSFVSSGLSQAKAAKQCGFSRTSAFRWVKRFEAGGIAALTPQHARSGRRGVAERSGVTSQLVKLLRAIILGVGSVTGGFRLFAEMSVCPPGLARSIRKAKTIPPSLRRLVAMQPVKLAGVRVGNQLVIETEGRA